MSQRKLKERLSGGGLVLLGTLLAQTFLALLFAPAAIAAGNAPAVSINTEDQTSEGVAPPGLPPPPSDPRDLEGSWYPFTAPGSGPKGPPPGNAGGSNLPGVKAAKSIFDNDENSPYSVELCNTPPLFLGTMGVAIVQSKRTLVVANEEAGDYRVIALGGTHPKHFVANRKGDSVGHWDGNTLVIDAIGFTLQDGSPSDAHVTERIYKDQNNTRLNDLVDVFYPSTGRHESRDTTYRWRPDLRVSEEVCEEGYAAFAIKNGKLVITE